MSIDRLLAFIIVGLTALLIGGMAGLWLGATSEHDALAELLAHGDFSGACRAEIDTALSGGNAHAMTP